jgi:phage terminase large subunit-like protein
VDILEGRRVDPTFYPVVYGLKDDEDWEDEANWYKVNPSLGYTVDIERLRDAYREAKQNPADEVTFKWLRMNMWVSSTTAWIPDAIFMKGNEEIDMASLDGRECYAGLDLSSTGDITAFVLMFPPRDVDEKYVVLPFFWVPEETIPQRVKAASVPYDVWEKQGYLLATEGNVIHYDFIEHFIEELGEKYHILEIAFERWGAVQMGQNLEGMGFTVVPFGQGFKDMSPPTKELMKLTLEKRIAHGGHPVLRWMMDNIFIRTDPAGNIKVTKARSKEKIDGIVAAIMALDRCIRNQGQQQGSVYDQRGLLVF